MGTLKKIGIMKMIPLILKNLMSIIPSRKKKTQKCSKLKLNLKFQRKLISQNVKNVTRNLQQKNPYQTTKANSIQYPKLENLQNTLLLQIPKMEFKRSNVKNVKRFSKVKKE